MPWMGIDQLPGMGDQAAGEDVVIKLECEAFLLLVPVFIEQVEEIVGVHVAGVAADLAGPVAAADDGHAIAINHLAG